MKLMDPEQSLLDVLFFPNGNTYVFECNSAEDIPLTFTLNISGGQIITSKMDEASYIDVLLNSYARILLPFREP